MRDYAEQKYKEHQRKTVALMSYPAQNNPICFDDVDITLIYLFARFVDPQLKKQLKNAIAAYTPNKHFHPDIHKLIAIWYERTDESHTTYWRTAEVMENSVH